MFQFGELSKLGGDAARQSLGWQRDLGHDRFGSGSAVRRGYATGHAIPIADGNAGIGRPAGEFGGPSYALGVLDEGEESLFFSVTHLEMMEERARWKSPEKDNVWLWTEIEDCIELKMIEEL
mmetsp:Transcript_3709/g.6968  ORF Transcript_3709/g.6968 Transcript_3709/m.6968 type:complete len:122 (+) Transcript_3709:170-535(+)